MKEHEIVKLFWQREAGAIEILQEELGTYCQSIARNLLGNEEDVEECVNDAYLRVWDSIPPQRPESLRAYMGRIIRNLALDRIKYRKTQKRGTGEILLLLEELGECVSDRETVETEIQHQELVQAINVFLREISAEQRSLFLGRYWYGMSIGELSLRTGKRENTISVILNRLRSRLRKYLMERGYEI